MSKRKNTRNRKKQKKFIVMMYSDLEPRNNWDKIHI